MTRLREASALQIWLVLVLATVLSWCVGTHAGVLAAEYHRVVTAVVLFVAFVKAHLIIHHFMEVRAAPRALRLAMAAWVAVVFAAIVGIDLCGPV
jgi:hypothetical protein